MNIQQYIIPYSELTLEKAKAGCFVIGMPNDEYHAYEGISNSGIKQVNITPAHYAFAEPREPSRAMEIGTAIHTAILEPERFESEYMVLKDTNARTATEYKQAIKTLGSERVLISSEARRVLGMQQAVQQSKTAMKILSKKGWAELSGFATDPETGVLLRVRFDWLAEDGDNLDVKKTQDARKDKFSRSITDYGYDQQAAFYRFVFNLITGEPMLFPFKLLAIEEKSPHGCRVRPVDDVSIHIGDKKWSAGLNTYAECEKSGLWPCYPDNEEETGVTNWEVNKYLEDEE